MNNQDTYTYKSSITVAAYLTERDLWPDFDRFLLELSEKDKIRKERLKRIPCSYCQVRDWEWTPYCEDYKKYGRPRFANKKDPHAPVYDIT